MLRHLCGPCRSASPCGNRRANQHLAVTQQIISHAEITAPIRALA